MFDCPIRMKTFTGVSPAAHAGGVNGAGAGGSGAGGGGGGGGAGGAGAVHVPDAGFQTQRAAGQSALLVYLEHAGAGGAGGDGAHVPNTAVAAANGRGVISFLFL